MKKLSVIVSVYNEEQALHESYKEMKSVLDAESSRRGMEYELCYVNDGSEDRSEEILYSFSEKDPSHVTVISFSKNFGHEAAMTAGLDYASGDILIFMDADLQHPPKCIPEIIEKFEEGADIVSMVRLENEDAGRWKNLTSDLFYVLINILSDMKIEPSASDFFAMNKKAADVLRSNYREKVRFLRGIVQNIGFRKTTIEYVAGRRISGSSHYSFRKLLRMSADTIICFSEMPLKVGIYAGIFTGIMGIILIVYSLITRNGAPSGYTTIVTVLCFFFAILFVILGIIGSYIAVLFQEAKDRPIYIVKDIKKSSSEDEKKSSSKTQSE